MTDQNIICKSCGDNSWWCCGCGSQPKLEALANMGLSNIEAENIILEQTDSCGEYVPCFICNRDGAKENIFGENINKNFWSEIEVVYEDLPDLENINTKIVNDNYQDNQEDNQDYKDDQEPNEEQVTDESTSEENNVDIFNNSLDQETNEEDDDVLTPDGSCDEEEDLASQIVFSNFWLDLFEKFYNLPLDRKYVFYNDLPKNKQREFSLLLEVYEKQNGII